MLAPSKRYAVTKTIVARGERSDQQPAHCAEFYRATSPTPITNPKSVEMT
jgi:hypothetical protein